MTYPVTIEEAFDEIDRLRRIEVAAVKWARAHRGHKRRVTLYEPDPGGHVPRSEFLAAERALLAEVPE